MTSMCTETSHNVAIISQTVRSGYLGYQLHDTTVLYSFRPYLRQQLPMIWEIIAKLPKVAVMVVPVMSLDYI